MNIDYWTREFVLFVISRIWGSILQIIAERPSSIVDIFKNKLQVAEVDNAGGRNLKMLEWM